MRQRPPLDKVPVGVSPNSLGGGSLSWAQAALKELSEPWRRGDKVKSMIGRAAKAAGLTYWRTFDIWYGKATRLTAEEAELIEVALKRKRKVVAHNELAELRARMARLESLYRSADPDFFGPEIAALRGGTVRTD